MDQYILSHDLGTSGNKASLFRDDGTLICSVTEPYPTIYGQDGWVEQNPEDWWAAVCRASKSITEKIDKSQIVAIAVTGQMMGTVMLDRNKTLLGNSIIWSDTRSAEECRRLEEKMGKLNYYRITGQPPAPSYPLPKIMWLKEHRPEQYEKTEIFIQAKDYINFRLTGCIATDYTDAAYTTAFDIEKKVWSEEILRQAEIDIRKFPPVRDSREILGVVSSEATESCGVLQGTPVVVSAGDGSAAHLGAGCTETGDTYICLGSSTWIVTQTSQLIFDEKGRMQSEPHVIDGSYCYLGTMQTGGLAYSWARHNLAQEPLSYEELDKLIEKTVPGAGTSIFLPYLMGERSPWYDMDAKGAFIGLTMNSSYGDFYRAVMEGVAMNLNILLNVIREAEMVNKAVLIGGGGKSRCWTQILADILNVELLLPENTDAGTSIGSAIIAGVGCGLWTDYRVAKKFLTIRQTVHPCEENIPLYQRKQEFFEKCYFALKELNQMM